MPSIRLRSSGLNIESKKAKIVIQAITNSTVNVKELKDLTKLIRVRLMARTVIQNAGKTSHRVNSSETICSISIIGNSLST